MLKLCQVLLLGCLGLLLPGCATTEKQSAPISDVLEARRTSGGIGIYKWKRDDIYAREDNGKLKYIGTVQASAPHFVVSFGGGGSEHRVLAISEDGRSIVFNHWKLHAPSNAGLEGGIHSYTYAGEVKKVHSEKPMSTNAWVRWPRPLPENLLPFWYHPPTYTPADMTWAIRADDSQRFPLALLDAKPIQQCAFDGNTEKCAELLLQGENINTETYWGFTALALAIIRNHEDTAIYLLRHGANPDTGIYPAFHYAVMLGRMGVIKAMIDQGVDVNKQTAGGTTPLHFAVYAGRVFAGGMHTFFRGAEKPNRIVDRTFTTSLVRLLLENGADPNIKNKSGKLPIDGVDAYTPEETTELLRKHMEKR